MGYLLLEEDLFVKFSVVDPHSAAGKKIHAFLEERARCLVGNKIDLTKNPVTFVMSDDEEPNAFFAASSKDQEIPKRDEYDNIQYTRNPLETHVICVTKGLIDLIDNLDQLDYVLGHELTHMLMRGYGIEGNSKGEEALSDLHSVDLVYDAGSDPKEALILQGKLHEVIKEKYSKMREQRRRHSRVRERDSGINWSEIFDVHVSHRNTKTALEASLTRLSHLIDSRQPSPIDKTIFDTKYSDPVTAYLNKTNYEEQDANGKLKILVDCIEEISEKHSPEAFFQAELDRLSEKIEELSYENDWEAYPLEREKKKIQECIENGYEKYFAGATIEKKYQQKISRMAEDVFAKAHERAREEDPSDQKEEINENELDLAMQNKAYAHIKENGYPKAGDMNFLEASGIMYTYFYTLFGRYGAHRPDGYIEEGTERVLPDIEVDIEKVKQNILGAQDSKTFMESVETFKNLVEIYIDFTSVYFSRYHSITKLDNLSFINHDRYSSLDINRIYPSLRLGESVPWNNLVKIAEESEEAREIVVSFLELQKVEDFRITHNCPFVREGRYSCYLVDEEGNLSERKEQYDLDYALRKPLVLQTYEYIKNYFENEEALFDQTCDAVLQISDEDFKKSVDDEGRYERVPLAQKKLTAFMELYNSLPREEDTDERHLRGCKVLDLISLQYLRDNSMPRVDKDGKSTLDNDLFKFDNPVFVEHFGEKFDERIAERKFALKDKMFKTALAAIEIMADMWGDAHPKAEEFQERSSKVRERLRGLDKDAEDYGQIQKDADAFYDEFYFYRNKAEVAKSAIFAYACCVQDDSEFYRSIHRITPEQKNILADLIIKDPKGLYLKVLEHYRYADFCDFRNVLSKQIDHIISSDYTLTDNMKIVAQNFGYKKSETKADLKDFIERYFDERDRYPKYISYLNVFDSMEYLEKSPDIDIRCLARAVRNIEELDPRRYTEGSGKLRQEAYRDYRRFVNDSRLTTLLGKAIDDQNNYNGLSVGEMIETADALVRLRQQMVRVVEDKDSVERYDEDRGYYNEVIDNTKPSNRELLNIFDRNISSLLRKAQAQALSNDDALEKITDLYLLYHPRDRDSSSEKTRKTYLKKIIREDNSLARIAELAKEQSFWPTDPLDYIKAFVFAKNTFLDDVELEDKLLNDAIDKIEFLPSWEKKKECLTILLDKNLRAAYPETRERIFDLYSDDILFSLGKDDSSTEYLEKLAAVLNGLDKIKEKDWDINKQHGSYSNFLSYSLAAADKYMLLRYVSDKIISQEEASAAIKKSCQVNLKSEDMVRSYLYGVGVEYLTTEMDREPDTAKKFIEFLNSKGELQDCHKISDYIKVSMAADEQKGIVRYSREEIVENTKPLHCKILYENFWSAPLEARAVIISRILKATCEDKAENTTEQPQQSWERVFDLVMDNLIRPDDTSVESRYARDIMHSYIGARSNYEREIILSAMMVANRNIGADAGNVGKALKLFLENMGPAEIKLGQAIASHPNTPDSIRSELQDLKNMADIPARWTLYEWIRDENIPQELWKNKYLGEVLGSASYYTSVDLGGEDVLRILRPEAREKAAKGFKVIGDTVNDLQSKNLKSDLDYGELTASVAEMVTQAARMSTIETDQEIGQAQYEAAQDIYDGVVINTGAEAFSLKTMEWKARGKNWVVMRKAEGSVFNAMPEHTAEQIAYKKEFAKAYLVFEMRQILSGEIFDHDRHGAQLCVNPLTNEAGLFDTGAMAVKKPSVQSQRQLGSVLLGVMKAVQNNKGGETPSDWVKIFSSVLNDKIDDLHNAEQDTQYLIEVKKGLLALGDFFKVLDSEDIEKLVPEIDIYSHISKHTKAAVQEGLSFSEKAKLKLFLAGQRALSTKHSVLITKVKAEITGNVISFAAARTSHMKSDWFDDLMENNAEDGDKSKRPGYSHTKHHASQALAQC